MRKEVCLLVYTRVKGGQNMVSSFCKRFLLHFGSIDYTISRFVL